MAKPWNDFPIAPDRIQALVGMSAGQSHRDLLVVQNILRRFNFWSLGHGLREGTMCFNTVRALRRFQEFYRVDGDQLGTIGPETVNAMRRPRCSMPDYPTSFRERIAWNRRDLQYAFGALNEFPDMAAPLDRGQFREAVGRAFDTWESAGVGLRFTEVELPEAHDMIIDWTVAADADLDMTGGTLAHGDFPPGGSIIVKKPPLPIHFDIVEHQWGVGPQEDTFDIQSVALHEIGHCLGLMHSDVPDAVMHSFAFPNQTRRDLHDDDLRGIRSLYPAAGTHETIALMAPNGLFACVDDDGSWRVIAYCRQIEDSARFSLIQLGDRQVALQATNGRFVTVAASQDLVASSDRIGEPETFRMISCEGVNQVLLTAHDGMLVRNEGGRILADGDRITAQTVFILTRTAAS